MSTAITAANDLRVVDQASRKGMVGERGKRYTLEGDAGVMEITSLQELDPGMKVTHLVYNPKNGETKMTTFTIVEVGESEAKVRFLNGQTTSISENGLGIKNPWGVFLVRAA